MDDLSRVRALTANKVSLAGIKATLGRELTRAEKAEYHKTRAALKLRAARGLDEDKEDNQRVYARDHNRRVREQRAKAALAELTSGEKSEKAQALEKSPEDWLLFFFPEMFPLPFSDGHRAIIKAIVEGDKEGRNVIVAAPRGEGKSTLEMLLAVYLVCSGKATFPIIGCWQRRSAREAYNAWVHAVRSERLIEHYPHLFKAFSGRKSAVRIRNDGTGADLQSDKLTIVLPGGAGALAAGSLQGDIKGFAIDTQDGRRLRPNKLLLDDPQDVQRAASPEYVEEVLKTIDSQWMCLAGPDTRLSMMAAVTIFAPDDVGDSLGKREDSVFVRISRVPAFPEEFMTRGSKCRDLWDECYSIRCAGGTKKSAAFYRKHKKEMTKGMKVSWKERFSRKLGDPDAFYAAICDYYRLGHDVFFSEYQNEPVKKTQEVYRLTPALVQSRVEPGRVRLDTPPGAALITAATDLNPSFGFTWSVDAFYPDQSCKVLAYGVYETKISEDLPRPEWNRRVFAALDAVGRMLSGLPCRPRVWGIDASGTAFDVALGFAPMALRTIGMNCVPMTGRAGKNWNPYARNRTGEARNGTIWLVRQGTSQSWMAWNTDVHRETMQRALLCPVGSPGGMTLFDGANHVEFSQQLSREVLEYKITFGERVDYKWKTAPGNHDHADCQGMQYALAAFYGMGNPLAGSVSQPLKKINPAARNANVRRW